MSISALILDRVNRKMLFPILPRAKGASIRRVMFVTEEIQALLTSPRGDLAWEQRIAELRADLEVFVEARTIDPKYLFLLYPAADATWEVRSIRDKPSLRILGGFADRDIFVATTFAEREVLGGWQSREWKTIKRRAAAKWRAMLHPYRPKLGINAKVLATGALDGKYFKTDPR